VVLGAAFDFLFFLAGFVVIPDTGDVLFVQSVRIPQEFTSGQTFSAILLVFSFLFCSLSLSLSLDEETLC
jgi:hypothetical protein